MLLCCTFDVLVRRDLDLPHGKFVDFSVSLLYAVAVSNQGASLQKSFFNQEICFDQMTSILFTTAEEMLLVR